MSEGTERLSPYWSLTRLFLSPLIQWQASEQGRPPEHTSKFYAKGALQYLVPILTQTLTKQVPLTSDLLPCHNCVCSHVTVCVFCRTRTMTMTTGTPVRRPACV